MEDTGLPASAEPLVVLAQLVVSGADCDRLTREAALATSMSLEADLCELLRLTPDGNAFFRVTSFQKESDREETHIPGGIASVAGYTLLCGTPTFSEDLARDQRFGAAGAPDLDGPVSAVAAPVPGLGNGPGVLVAYAGRVGAFGPCQALSVSRMASLLGGALELLRELDELRCRVEKADHCSGVGCEIYGKTLRREERNLTDRQLDVLQLLAKGLPAKGIASKMNLSIHTIHSHKRSLYLTLGVVSATGAIRRAEELRLL